MCAEERSCEDTAKGSHLQAKKNVPGETESVLTLILDFQPEELRENKFLMSKPPSL